MLHKHEPCSMKLIKRRNPKDSICGVLVEIYNLTDDPEIKLKCRVATSMAKSMSNKITNLKAERKDVKNKCNE